MTAPQRSHTPAAGPVVPSSLVSRPELRMETAHAVPAVPAMPAAPKERSMTQTSAEPGTAQLPLAPDAAATASTSLASKSILAAETAHAKHAVPAVPTSSSSFASKSDFATRAAPAAEPDLISFSPAVKAGPAPSIAASALHVTPPGTTQQAGLLVPHSIATAVTASNQNITGNPG